MFDQWKVLHLDEVEAESFRFCRALSHEHFAEHCESVRTIADAKLYLERALYTPQLLSRPDIVVVNWHPDCDAHVLELVHWIRAQPQFHTLPIIVFIQAQLSLNAQDRAAQEGVTEMLVCPDKLNDLRSQVRDLLQRCATLGRARQVA
jgi:CheY-like chemotaxis protein